MIVLKKTISTLVADDKVLDIGFATLILEEENGIKTWHVTVTGGQDLFTQLSLNKENYHLKMYDLENVEYTGYALVKDENTFLGTGRLNPL